MIPEKIKPYSNQNVIRVEKSICNSEHLYSTTNIQAETYAAKRLQSKAGFKLYRYIAANQNNYVFALSSKDFCTNWGVGEKAYTAALKDLIDNKFLVLIEKVGTNNFYAFRDCGDCPITSNGKKLPKKVETEEEEFYNKILGL